MKYRTLYNLELATGDVVLYHTPLSLRPVSWLSWAIRKITKSYWNHAALAVRIYGNVYLAEALGGGVRLRPALKHLDRKRCHIKILRPTDRKDPSVLRAIALEKLGTRYDVLAILQHLYKAVRRKWTGHTGDFAEGRMVCSEYVAYAHQLPEWWQITPADLDRCPKFKTVFSETENS